MSDQRGQYRSTKPRPSADAWPHRAPAPEARDIHLGRIADALEGILEALVGIQAQIPDHDHNHEDRTHGV